MKKIMIMAASLSILTGCASVFDPNGASSNFSCIDPNNPDKVVDGVTCKTPFAIYQSTHEPAELKQSDLPIGVSLQDYEAEKTRGSYEGHVSQSQLMDGVYQGQGYQVPGQMMEHERPQYVRPVRMPATVMRIWLAPWIDANDDLHFPSHIYTEIQPRRWAFGESEFVGRGMTVPTRPIANVPTSRVKDHQRPAPETSQQLQPYQATTQTQPIGTGIQMPTLP